MGAPPSNQAGQAASGTQQKPTQPPGQKPPQGQQKPPPKQPQKPAADPGTASIETIQQGFNVVLTQFAKTNDRVTIQKILKALTGKVAVTDLPRELMMELGPLLRRAIKGELKWNGSSLHEPSGDQLWPKHQEQPEPPFEDPPPQQDGPPLDNSEPMF